MKRVAGLLFVTVPNRGPTFDVRNTHSHSFHSLFTEEKGQLRIKRGAADKGKVPLFVRFVFQSIWDIYEVSSSSSPTRARGSSAD